MSWLNNNFISQFFVEVIQFFESFTGNYLIAVLLFTLAVKLIILPLEIHSKKATMKTQIIQPKVKAIQERYKHDPRLASMKVRELYKKENVKMTAGCLPLLLQLPIILAMFGAVRVLSSTESVKLVVGMMNDPTLLPPSMLWIHNIWMPDTGTSAIMPTLTEFSNYIKEVSNVLDPTVLANANQLVNNSLISEFVAGAQAMSDSSFIGGIYHSAIASYTPEMISAASTMNYQSVIAPTLAQYEGYANGFFVFPLLAGVTMYISMKLTNSQTKKQSGGQGMMGGGMMELLMPIMVLWFASTSSVPFAMYWTITNVITIIQNLVMNRIYKDKYPVPDAK